MLKCNNRDSFRYCATVTVLFLLWGISYGLLNTLNNVVAAVADMSTAETLGLAAAYFGVGYFFGPLLVGEWILRLDEHHRVQRSKDNDAFRSVGGFKATFIVGLCFYGIGTIIFWPSAVMKSWGGFLLSNFVVGFGLSILETGANAFLILCGPQQYGETRLCLAQAVQAIGTLLSATLAQKLFFTGIAENGYTSSMTLLNVQWTYLAITLLCVALALFFYYMPLPEVGDAELQEAADRLPVNPERRTGFFGLQLRTVSLILAFTAQYTYLACQESNSIWFRQLLISVLPSQDNTGHGATDSAAASPGETADKPAGLALAVVDFGLIAQAAFAISRVLVAYLTYKSVKNPKFPKPRTRLGISVILAFVFALLIVVIRPSNPNLVAIPVVLFYFAEGPCWPLIFAIGLRGQGRRTKRAAAFITMAASGAAWFPFALYAVVRGGGTVQLSFVIIVALLVLTFAYPLFLHVCRDARIMTDPRNRIVLSGGSRVASRAGQGGLGPGGQLDLLQLDREVAEQNRPPRRRPTAEMVREKGVRFADVFGSHLGIKRGSGGGRSSNGTPPRIEHSEGEEPGPTDEPAPHQMLQQPEQQQKRAGTAPI